MRRNLRSSWATTVLLSALIVGLLGATTASGAHKSSQALPTLKVAISVPDPGFLPLYVGVAKGFFAAEGLPVQIVYAGANVTTAVVSGQADLNFGSLAVAFSPVQSGSSTSIIFVSNDARYVGSAYAKTGVNSIQDCKSVTSPPLTGTYAWAAFYKQFYHLNYDLVPLPAASGVAAVASGQIDCSVNTSAQFGTAVAAGQAHNIIDTTNPTTIPKGLPAGISNSVLWGMTDHLRQIRPQIVAFLAGLNLSMTYIENTPAADINALVLKAFPSDLGPLSAALQAGIASAQPFFAPLAGYLAQNAWGADISFYQPTLSYLDTSKQWSWGSRVDMSYYQAAVGLALQADLSSKGVSGATGAAKSTGLATLTVKKTLKLRHLSTRLALGKLSSPVTSVEIRALTKTGSPGALLVTVCSKNCKNDHSYSMNIGHGADSAIESLRAYTIVKTAKNPNGEIKGSIVPVHR